VNTWGAPVGVLRNHPKDQIADFVGNPSPANYPAGSGNCTPIDCKPRSVPTYNRLRAHNDESLFPFGPEPSRQDPEELIEGCQPWPGMLSLQCYELLAKSQFSSSSLRRVRMRRRIVPTNNRMASTIRGCYRISPVDGNPVSC
jgi:hypothetical protein